MAKLPDEPDDLRDGLHGIASVGDEVIADGFATAYGVPPLKKPSDIINIDDLPDSPDADVEAGVPTN